jgi:hypothetical protein
LIEALFHFLVEVLLYGKGYWSLRLLSLGRIEPSDWNDGLVSAIGLAVTLAWCVPLLLWLTGNPQA